MDAGDAARLILTTAVWAIGVQATIWWPRKVRPDSARARAYAALRLAAAGMLLGYVLLLATVLKPVDEGMRLQIILSLITLGTLLLTPLSSVALGLDRGRRLRAMVGSYLAMLFAAGLTWSCLIVILTNPGNADMTLWRQIAICAATIASGGAVASALEMYAVVRQPRAKWRIEQ